MKIIDCEQKTVEWWNARRGIPTASEFGRIITAKTGEACAKQDSYVYELIAQRYAPIWPEPDAFVSKEMQHGIDNEQHARAWYGFSVDAQVQQAGFCLSDCGRYGASPDGLVGDDGGLELKCPSLHTHVRYLIEGVLPSDYRAQVHGELLVTGRKWWDFVSWCEGLPPFMVRVEPDDYTVRLKELLDKFCGSYATTLARLETLRAA